MPGLDGLHLQQKLEHSTHGISIIFITGHRGRVMAKMKAQSIADLMRAAEKIGKRQSFSLSFA